MSDWIDVQDRLPEDFKRVWVFSTGGGVWIASQYAGIWTHIGYSYAEETISHWQPLEFPTPPIKSNRKD